MMAAPRKRDIEQFDQDLAAILQDEGRADVARDDALVAAIFRHAEGLAVGEPGQLVGKFLALEQRHIDLKREAVVELPGHHPFDPPELVEVADDPFADSSQDRHHQRDPAGRHVERLARKFLAARQHVTTQKRNLDTLMPTAFVRLRFSFQKRCDGHGAGLSEDREPESTSLTLSCRS